MKFEPTNRHIQIIPIEEEKKESDLAIVLPDDYKEPLSPYLLCEVVACAKDSKFRLTGDNTTKIVVERRMLHKIEINNEAIYLILDNYVFGSIKE